MSSVPAARIDPLAHSTRPSLRLATTDPVELYPSLFQTLRTAVRRPSGAAGPPSTALIERGRATGARV